MSTSNVISGIHHLILLFAAFCHAALQRLQFITSCLALRGPQFSKRLSLAAELLLATMPGFISAAVIAVFTLCARGTAGARSNDLAPIYLDNIEFTGNDSNLIEISYDALKKAVASPASVSAASADGFDWTKPYPGEKIAGHKMYLTVARDVPLPESIVENSTTTVTSLTFSIPDSMMAGSDTPAHMDPSWYICRSILVGVKSESQTAVENGKGCGFLSIRASLI